MESVQGVVSRQKTTIFSDSPNNVRSFVSCRTVLVKEDRTLVAREVIAQHEILA